MKPRRAPLAPEPEKPDGLPEGAGGLPAALRILSAAFAQAADVLTGQAVAKPLATPSRSVAEVANELLVNRVRGERRDRYLIQLRSSLVIFLRGMGSDATLEELTAERIEEWLAGLGVSSRTRKNYLTDVRTLLNFAVDRGYLDRSPARGVAEAHVDRSPPKIHTPAEVRQIMGRALATDPGLARFLALAYFAGLRPTEAERLSESNLLTGQGLVDVPAAKAKTRSRRLVSIGPTLAAWLSATEAFPLPVSNLVKRRRRLVASCGVPWSPDVTRHSFVSYHLAAGQSAAKTALEAGHSEAMLFRHYRALVTPEAAAEFWGILPA